MAVDDLEGHGNAAFRVLARHQRPLQRGLPAPPAQAGKAGRMQIAAKGAQLGLTRSWAMELAKHGITVNLVSPGWIPTERHDNDPQEMKDDYASKVPMGHMGEHEDVAEAVAFLASDGAKFITGQKISVNGGNTLA